LERLLHHIFYDSSGFRQFSVRKLDNISYLLASSSSTLLTAIHSNVRRFGQLEFYLSTAKILVLIALIVFGTGVDAGGTRLRPDARETIKPYFGYWQEPHGPMGHMTFVGNDTSTNNFLGLWACTGSFCLKPFLVKTLMGIL
jgi:amino acid permease